MSITLQLKGDAEPEHQLQPMHFVCFPIRLRGDPKVIWIVEGLTLARTKTSGQYARRGTFRLTVGNAPDKNDPFSVFVPGSTLYCDYGVLGAESIEPFDYIRREGASNYSITLV
jgi:hypothetical protein